MHKLFMDAVVRSYSHRALALLIVAAVGIAIGAGSPALAQGAGAARDVLGDRIIEALNEPLPDGGIAISVVLREPLSQGRQMSRGTARQARVADRQNRVLTSVYEAGFTLRHRYREVSGFAGWASAEAIAILAEHPEVLSVDLERPSRLNLSHGVPMIGADVAHAAGVTGNGVIVAVLDTGFDSDHPYLVNALVAEACFCDDHPSPSVGCCPDGSQAQLGIGSAEDDNGHGTEMSGVITSDNATRKGVAPDAKIVAVKVSPASGGGSLSDITAGLDWVLASGIALGVQVVNISISDGAEHGDSAVLPCTGSNLGNSIAALDTAGVVVFASSGNDGYSNGISHPACVPQAISVASVFDANFGGIDFGICEDTPATVDQITCISNTGSILDILAPGAITNTSQMGGGHAGEAGTSIASAYASGQAALLLEADPTLTPGQIKALMVGSGPLVVDADNQLSFPRADIEDALIALPEPAGSGLIFGAMALGLLRRSHSAR
jgi:subtilisin family serine protease